MDRYGVKGVRTLILFLAAFMKKGYGVSVVIDNLCQEYARMGIDVAVGCLETDGFFKDAKIVELEPNFDSVHAFASKLKCSVIVSHTTPFFELLPQLSEKYQVWSWEHGDPNPEFFIWDRQERQEIIRRKQCEVYSQLNGVIAISEFIKKEINHQQATVIYNCCDHIDQSESKKSTTTSPIRIGTLVRLGASETTYKGRPIRTQLYKKLSNLDAPLELHIMGRGTTQDKQALENMGIVVHLNSTDEERLEYLNNLDIFVSTSLWEGFNLPLVEAQASGTVGIAFDVGAHPETTPFITRGVDDMVSLIDHYCQNPGLLQRHSVLCERWVRERFRWEAVAVTSSNLFLNNQLT
jgi:glycosyltransferase involved in cell wall biosynthesis